MTKPLRSDNKYLEIEKFKDYEVTQCIAYEMAIRNPEVKTLVEERNAIDVFGDFTQSEVDTLLKVESYKQADKFMSAYFRKIPVRKKWLNDEIRLDADIKKLSYFNIPSTSDAMSSQLLGNPYFKKYLDKVSQRSQALKSSIIKKEGLGIKKMFEDNGTALTTTGATINYEALYPKFSRPHPEIPTETSKEIDLLLNLALPANDIATLVEAIKKVYDKSKGEVYKVSTPLETVASIDKEIFEIKIKTKKRGSPTKYEIPKKSQQEVYADLLFLYDVYTHPDSKKQSDKLQHFIDEMLDYYAEKVCKYNGVTDDKEFLEVLKLISTPRDQTIRKYSAMMKSYIDDFGYKKLLA